MAVFYVWWVDFIWSKMTDNAELGIKLIKLKYLLGIAEHLHELRLIE
jgi:hypothetical protein